MKLKVVTKTLRSPWFWIGCGFVVAPILYYAWAINDARANTTSYVAEAYARWGSSVDVSAFSSERISWLLAVEDPAFYEHKGVDFETPGAGMTTLTQGLVKLLYFPDGFRPGLAKIEQTLIARYVLDAMVSKDEQLRLFLNIAYFGADHGKSVHGFDAAARAYFNKTTAELTDQEFLSLVAMFIAPSTLKPGTENNRHRVQTIQMFLSGEIVPTDVLDVGYEGKSTSSFAKKAFVAFLRLITD